jgi:hypothetical protein
MKRYDYKKRRLLAADHSKIRPHLPLLLVRLMYCDNFVNILEIFELSLGQVKYWKKKLEDPTYHDNSWGGARNFKYDTDDKDKIHQLIYEYLVKNTSATQQDVIHQMSIKGFNINQTYISRLYRSWGWKRKKKHQKNKFTSSVMTT